MNLTENHDLDDEVNEFWISKNNAFRLFSKNDVDNYLLTLSGERVTNIMFRHIKCPHSISKAQVIEMSDEDIHLYLQMVADHERSQDGKE